MKANKILVNRDDKWITKLWEWADENNLSPVIIPRIKEELLSICIKCNFQKS